MTVLSKQGAGGFLSGISIWSIAVNLLMHYSSGFPAGKEERLRVWQDEIAALKRLNMPQTEKRYEARKGNMPRGLPHTIIEYVPFTRSTSVCLYVVL